MKPCPVDKCPNAGDPALYIEHAPGVKLSLCRDHHRQVVASTRAPRARRCGAGVRMVSR